MPAAQMPQRRSRAGRAIAAAAVVLLVLGAATWWLIGSRVWTDDRTIRIDDDAASVRAVLWTKPRPVDAAMPGEAPINTGDDEYEPAMSPDGVELYFVRGLAGDGKQQQADIYVSHRRGNRWSAAQPLKAINSSANELGPRLSHDGRTLYFYSDRAGGHGGYDIWRSRRKGDGWGEAVNLGPAVNGPHNEFNPAPTPDGRRMLFASNRNAAALISDAPKWDATIRHNPVATQYDLFIAVAAEFAPHAAPPDGGDAGERAAAFAPAIEVPQVNTPFNEGAACVAPAGDYLYFTSNRDGAGHGYDLFRCRLRPAEARGVSADDPRIAGGLLFQNVEKVSELNTPHDEADPALTLEGFRVMISSNAPGGAGGYDLYVADSREVFVDRDGRTLPALGWSWWVLLAAVGLLLLLLFLFRNIESEKLGLFQRCLIVSIFVHLIVTILLSFFWVTKEVYEHVVEQEEMRITVNLDAALETQLRLATRSQHADLSEPAPASEAPRQATPAPPVPVFAPRDIPFDIPPAPRGALSPTMVVPAVAKQPPTQAKPASAAAELPAAQAPLVDLSVMAQARPVTASEPAQPTMSDQPPAAPRREAVVLRGPAEVSQPRPDPSAQVTPRSFAAAAAAARPRADAASPADAPAAPAPVAPQPVVSPVAQSKPVRSDRPDGIEVPQASAPLATRAATRPASEAGEAPMDVPPAKTLEAAKPAGQSLIQSPASKARDVSTAAAAASAAPDLPFADVPLQLEPDLQSPVKRIAADEALPAPVSDESPAAAKAKSQSAQNAAAADALAAATPAFPANQRQADATSLSGIPDASDLRARSSAAASPAAEPGELALPSLHEALGPSGFAAPAPLFQRAADVRRKLVEKMGGTAKSEQAVDRALAYLARNQEPDGRWTMVQPGDKGPGKRSTYAHDMALTGLAVLTFLGADHTPSRPGPYREQVARGIEYLVKRTAANGDARGDGNMYDQGIVAIALAEAALMSGDPKARDAALAAARFISGAQHDDSGGWRYKPDEYGDTSVLGWQIMALHSAEQLGLPIDKNIRQGAERWLERVTKKDSLVAGYQQESPRPSMTAEAVFTRILLEQEFDEKQLNSFEKYMFENPAGKGEPDYYYLYYATLSFNQLQGESWARWNEPTREYIIKQQRRGGNDDGSWNMVNRWDRKGGQIYTTCMAALTLEVYYRYLPMYASPPE